MLTYSINRRTTPGPLVHFQCPKCHGTLRTGTAYELHDKFVALHFLPLWSTRATYVECAYCRTTLNSVLGVEELAVLGDTDVTPYLSYEASFVFKFLAIVSLLLVWMPLVGTVMALITLAGTFRVPGWPRTLARVCTVLSVLLFAAYIVAVAINEMG